VITNPIPEEGEGGIGLPIIMLLLIFKESIKYLCVYLLLRKREDPEQRSTPSAMMAIRSPRRSASSL
jgi:hypothetical protein